MRRQLMGGLVAVVTGVVVSASGVTDVRASLVAPSTPVAARAASPMAPVAPGPAAQLWVARYNGPGNINDLANSVAVSPAGGTVFVTGASGGSSLKYDYGTVAYDAATGAQLWGARYNGPANGSNDAHALAVSPSGGTVFVTGDSTGTTSLQDYATVAYNAATGARLWVARYNGPGNGNDGASSVAVSPGGGKVFVTGASTGTTSGSDYATVAYNAATGARLWVARYNGPGNGNDGARAVAVSPTGGTVYVTGYDTGKTSGSDYATVAYNAATGARLWVARYNRPGNGSAASSMAVSPGGGKVFVTGASTGATSSSDYATVAYNAATGARLWVARYNGPRNSIDAATSVAVSPAVGTVFVTGYSWGTTSGSDYATVAYNAATGARLWVARYNGPGNSDDIAYALAVSPAGETVYVTGGDTGTGGSDDYATTAYDATTGAPLWVARYNGPVGQNGANALAVSPHSGTVYVTGQSLGTNSGYDYATVAYHG